MFTWFASFRSRSVLIAAAAACLLVLPGAANTLQQQEALFCPTCEGCTSVLVGKAASVDGSTMTSHSCDSTTDRTWMNIVPGAKHKPGEMAKVYFDPKRTKGPDDTDRIETGEIPQVPETYAYLNAAYPIMNEHQLAIGETTFGGKREMYSDNGIIDCPELYRLVLERAKTAREAIRIADELTKQYGYNDYGEAFTFADPKETWFFEILGPGKGRKGAVWAAVRIPDDHVAVSANAPRIRKVDLEDRDNYMASANVFTLAEELGLWSPKSGEPFEFCTVYGSRSSLGSRRREWRALSRIAPSLKLDPNAEHYPLSVKAEKKMGVPDVLEIFRDTYQDTPFDMTRSLTTVGQGRQGGEEPGRQPVHVERLPAAVQRDVRAHHRLQARHLPADHPVARLAPQPDRRPGVARVRQPDDHAAHPVLHRHHADAEVVHGGRPREVPPRLRMVGLPAGEPAGHAAVAGDGEGHREGLAPDRGEGLRRAARNSRRKPSASTSRTRPGRARCSRSTRTTWPTEPWTLTGSWSTISGRSTRTLSGRDGSRLSRVEGQGLRVL